MKSIGMLRINSKLEIGQIGVDGGQGYVNLGRIDTHFRAAVVFSCGGGWDHVSASYPDRCPTWEEMCKVKDIFFMERDDWEKYGPKSDKKRSGLMFRQSDIKRSNEGKFDTIDIVTHNFTMVKGEYTI